MKNAKFLLCAAAILLAGALAAGLAAQRVVAPEKGVLHDGGTAEVPSVLGQTAEEVRFYPWSFYGNETLRKLTDEEWLTIFSDIDVASEQAVETDLKNYIAKFREMSPRETTEFASFAMDPLFDLNGICPGLGFEMEDLMEGLEVNYLDDYEVPPGGAHMFIRDMPVVDTYNNEQALLLNAAVGDGNRSGTSVMILPLQQEMISEEQKEEAMQIVQDDFNALFTTKNPWIDGSNPLGYIISENAGYVSVDLFLRECESVPYEIQNSASGDLLPEPNGYTVQGTSSADYLRALTPWDVQFITTDTQVVLLLTRENQLFGIYYDIQLGRYSGFGQLT